MRIAAVITLVMLAIYGSSYITARGMSERIVSNHERAINAATSAQ